MPAVLVNGCFSFTVSVFRFAFTCLLGEQFSCGAQVKAAFFWASCIKHSGFFSLFLKKTFFCDSRYQPSFLVFFLCSVQIFFFLIMAGMLHWRCSSPRHCLRKTAPFDSKAEIRHRLCENSCAHFIYCTPKDGQVFVQRTIF